MRGCFSRGVSLTPADLCAGPFFLFRVYKVSDDFWPRVRAEEGRPRDVMLNFPA